MADEGNGTLLLILLWIIWPVGLIWYLADPNMQKIRWVKYQFKQWLGAIIASIIIAIVAGILTLVLIGVVIFVLLWILGIVWFIQGIIFAVQHAEKPLWLIGNITNDKLKF